MPGNLSVGLAISTPVSIADQLVAAMASLPRETFRLLHLDTRNRLLADEIMWEGTVDHVHIYPREAVRRVIEVGATAIIAVHNHPHGDPTPSRADVRQTNLLWLACDAIGVILHDHIVVAARGWFSMAAAGLLRSDTGLSRHCPLNDKQHLRHVG